MSTGPTGAPMVTQGRSGWPGSGMGAHFGGPHLDGGFVDVGHDLPSRAALLMAGRSWKGLMVTPKGTRGQALDPSPLHYLRVPFRAVQPPHPTAAHPLLAGRDTGVSGLAPGAAQGAHVDAV